MIPTPTNARRILCIRYICGRAVGVIRVRVNTRSAISLLLLLAASVALAERPQAIERITLDDRAVTTVPVSTNRVTTISFPGPITAIDGFGFTLGGKSPGQFQLAHVPGSAFLSVRALAPRAATNFNIRWNNRTYVFELVQSETPVLALNLEAPRPVESVPLAPQLTPARLLGLLDEAKAFPLLRQQHPEAVVDATARTFGEHPPITDFNDFEIRLEEVFRFETEDTLVFHVILRNKSDREIRYLPGSFRGRIGDRVYYQSISDTPGVLPPKAESTVYFAITGSPDGGRNDLSLQNDFTILVTRLVPRPPPANPGANSLPVHPRLEQP